jgi:dTDP-4-dehydrorhamnose reductase
LKDNVLVTGGSGRLGRELVKVFPDALYPSRKVLDVTNTMQVYRYFDKFKPDVVIHLAAKTSVSFCEDYKTRAYLTNVDGTKNLLRALSDCYFVYVSTPCVFHGDKGDYVENDLPYPKNYYGLTKYIAELWVLNSGFNSLVIRTNFVAREKWPYSCAFVDRFGTYLFADDVAKAVKWLVANRFSGVVHVCGEEKLSMFELAQITTPTIKPMTLDDVSLPLTVDMSLRSNRIEAFTLTR